MKKKWRRLISWIILSILTLYAVTPLYLLFINSFKTRGEIFSNPFKLPERFSLRNYARAWKYADLKHGLLNSFVFASSSAVLQVFLGGMAAYVLRRKSTFSSSIMSFLLFCNTLPLFVMLIPLYVWFSSLKLTNIIGVIIVTVGLSSPFSIMLLRSFMVAFPQELEEAALIDGANRWQILWRVILPILKPAFLTVALVNFLGGWNAFTIPLTFLADSKKQTAIIKIFTLSGQYTAPWGEIFAAIVMVTLPVLVLFLLLQKYFVAGLIRGAFK